MKQKIITGLIKISLPIALALVLISALSGCGGVQQNSAGETGNINISQKTDGAESGIGSAGAEVKASDQGNGATDAESETSDSSTGQDNTGYAAFEEEDASAENDVYGDVPDKNKNDSSGKEGTGSSVTGSREYEEFASGHTFIDDLSDEDLKKPDRAIKSLEDYIYLLDYLAFYRVGEKVFFDIDPEYAEEIYNPYTIHQKAYEMADLADVYACQMDDSYYSELGVIGVKYSMSRDIASEEPENITDTPVLPSFDYRIVTEKKIALSNSKNPDNESQKTETDENNIYKDAEDNIGAEKNQHPENNRNITCENSEQLYYLVMNGYKPTPVSGSIAEQLYQEAEAVLERIITPDMSDFQKIKAVYDWLTTEVVYDSETAYSADTYLVKEQAYYLEGVFFNHCAVCDGKAKACALLLNMTGIPCWRTTGVNEGGDHAWNMVWLDGEWYILCTTYGQADMTESLGRIVPNYSMLLAGKNTPYEWYPAQKHQDVEERLAQKAFDVYGRMGEDDGVSLKIKDINELESLMEEVGKLPGTANREYKIEFVYEGEDKEGFEAALTEYLETLDNVNAAPVKNEDHCVYQIMCQGNGSVDTLTQSP